MPFDPHELDTLDDGFGSDDEAEEHDDEIEDEPRSWDLTAGRAGAHDSGRKSILDLDVAELISLVWDGVQPDGSEANAKLRIAVFAAWRIREPQITRALAIALTGADANGEPVDAVSFERACRYLDRRRRRSLESASAFEPPPANPTGRKPAPANAVKIIAADGTIDFGRLGNDDQAVREAAVLLSGLPIEELVAPFKQGPHQSGAERARRARQALTIARLLERGATQRAIVRIFGVSAATVSKRAELGRQLAERLAK